MNYSYRFFSASVCLAILSFTTISFSAIAKTDFSLYGELPFIQNMSISPSGKYLAYRRTDDNGDVVVVYSTVENKIISGINAAEVSPQSIYFTDDNTLILVASGNERIAGYRGKHDISTAFVFNVKDKELKQLLRHGGRVYTGQTQLGNIVGVSPDSKKVYMSAYAGHKLSIADKARPKYALFSVKLDRPKRPGFHAYGTEHTVDYFVGPDGEPLVEERYNNNTNQHEILVNRGEDWESIYQAEVPIRTFSPVGLSQDYRSLIILQYDNETERLGYFQMSLSDGTITPSSIVRADADVERVITDINRVVYGVVYSGFTLDYHFFDPALHKRMQTIIAQFPNHTVWLKSWSQNWRDIVVYVEGPGAPGDFYLFPEKDAPYFVATSRPEIAPEQIQPIAEVTVLARDGLKIPSILTIPSQHVENMKNLPTVILPHGGPASYDRIRFDWLAQALAANGYLVMQPQYRGSAGFGLKHKQAGHGQWGKKMQDDLSDALAFLVKKGITDPSQVCIAGASYGGYAALAAGAFSPEQYQCVVSINGVSDLNRMLSSEEYYHGSNHWVVSYWQELMSKGEADDDYLATISPYNFADKWQAPTLLIYSENDVTVRPYQSERMYDKLRSHDKHAKMVELPDDNHHLQTAEARHTLLTEMLAFIDQHLSNNSETAAP